MRLNPLRVDITTEAGALFDNHPRLNNKMLLLDITIVSPCAGSNLGNAARQVGKQLADAIEWKKNKYRGSFPATYFLLPLAISTCGVVGSDVHALIKVAITRVEHMSETHSNESQYLAEGTLAPPPPLPSPPLSPLLLLPLRPVEFVSLLFEDPLPPLGLPMNYPLHPLFGFYWLQ